MRLLNPLWCKPLCLFISIGQLSANLYAESASDHNENDIEEIHVIADRLFADSTRLSPSSRITADDLKAISLLTAEDSIAYEPNLVVRRRYVGDPNGVLGIRGSGMFQTARSLVFADGLPLHYLLQTRWSGSPRWSLLGPDEIANATVIYGPYSAEYSGNAMGGVVDIKTRTPQERRFIVQGHLLSQDYDALGKNDSVNGNKIYMAYEDNIGDLSLSASYNRLRNDSQPMSQYFTEANEAETLDELGVTGYVRGQDKYGNDVIYIGDSGAEESTTELYKLKLNYQLGNMQLRGTIAYEDRIREEHNKRNYLIDATGNTYWGLGNRNFEQRSQERNSLLLGFGVSAEIWGNWFYDIYTTNFEIIKDKEQRSGLNPNDPSFGSRNGRLTQFGDTGWNTLDIKLGTDTWFDRDDMRLSIGFLKDRYQLAINGFNLNASDGSVVSTRSPSQGETSTTAVFAQWGWQSNEHLDIALGLRYEQWRTQDGLYNNIQAPKRDESSWSPKFSIGYTLNEQWSLRYSAAEAYRFPIVEELYRNEAAATAVLIADASLEPEQGFHQNISLINEFDSGKLQINVFWETIKDSIYNQRGTINDGGNNISVSTFLAIDEVNTSGVEFIYEQRDFLLSKLSLRFNLNYTDAEISENSANTRIEGNDLPRIPSWRSNLMLSYPLNDQLSLHSSFRYASNSHGDLDNSDGGSEVFGAIDDYFFVNSKVSWRMNDALSISAGVDNIFNDTAYVAHPWPSRSYYLEGRYQF
ncbi:TonB-dependent receptor [Pseudoteredinibacter isoporae]|uniref:TonB-dependent receptor n=1 Tax=Pseudoteredinibacter isoporae TaxID=570281 RepID=UPI00310410A3